VRGLPPDLAVQAIAALGAIREESSSAAIAPYVSHRVEAVRRAAAEALGNTRGPQAAAALLAGLRSSDGAVRALSARGLRFAGDADSVPDLLRALDRGELDAAPSIAALCPADACRDLLRRLGPVVRSDRTARPVMDDVLFVMLTRKGKLPDDVLLAAVEMVGASGSPSSKERLRGLRKTPSLPPRVRKAIEAAVREPGERKP
jgi:HEAT repeat protein